MALFALRVLLFFNFYLFIYLKNRDEDRHGGDRYGER